MPTHNQEHVPTPSRVPLAVAQTADTVDLGPTFADLMPVSPPVMRWPSVEVGFHIFAHPELRETE